MARSKEIVIVTGAGLCGCGCKGAVKRTYKQGHDAKLKGILGRAHKAGQQVAITNDGARATLSAEELLMARGWPVPAVPTPKPSAKG